MPQIMKLTEEVEYSKQRLRVVKIETLSDNILSSSFIFHIFFTALFTFFNLLSHRRRWETEWPEQEMERDAETATHQSV